MVSVETYQLVHEATSAMSARVTTASQRWNLPEASTVSFCLKQSIIGIPNMTAHRGRRRLH